MNVDDTERQAVSAVLDLDSASLAGTVHGIRCCNNRDVIQRAHAVLASAFAQLPTERS